MSGADWTKLTLTNSGIKEPLVQIHPQGIPDRVVVFSIKKVIKVNLSLVRCPGYIQFEFISPF